MRRRAVPSVSDGIALDGPRDGLARRPGGQLYFQGAIRRLGRQVVPPGYNGGVVPPRPGRGRCVVPPGRLLLYVFYQATGQLIVVSILAVHQVYLALLLDALDLETLGQDVHQA